eukprot:Hpha_TRINITY_DN5145_c0_g1::TRINITY_DN5145_c0_g1_i1::g.192863::m.192863
MGGETGDVAEHLQHNLEAAGYRGRPLGADSARALAELPELQVLEKALRTLRHVDAFTPRELAEFRRMDRAGDVLPAAELAAAAAHLPADPREELDELTRELASERHRLTTLETSTAELRSRARAFSYTESATCSAATLAAAAEDAFGALSRTVRGLSAGAFHDARVSLVAAERRLAESAYGRAKGLRPSPSEDTELWVELRRCWQASALGRASEAQAVAEAAGAEAALNTVSAGLKATPRHPAPEAMSEELASAVATLLRAAHRCADADGTGEVYSQVLVAELSRSNAQLRSAQGVSSALRTWRALREVRASVEANEQETVQKTRRLAAECLSVLQNATELVEAAEKPPPLPHRSPTMDVVPLSSSSHRVAGATRSVPTSPAAEVHSPHPLAAGPTRGMHAGSPAISAGPPLVVSPGLPLSPPPEVPPPVLVVTTPNLHTRGPSARSPPRATPPRRGGAPDMPCSPPSIPRELSPPPEPPQFPFRTEPPPVVSFPAGSQTRFGDSSRF